MEWLKFDHSMVKVHHCVSESGNEEAPVAGGFSFGLVAVADAGQPEEGQHPDDGFHDARVGHHRYRQ